MAVYVYAITEARHPLPVDGATGVGETPAPLRVVRGKEVAAVVGDAPEQLRAKRRDLKAHQDVLESLAAGGAVLPMRFGLVAPDDEAVQRELVAREAEYLERLERVRDRVEFNLKAVQDEDTALRTALRENPEVRRLNELTRAGAGGYEDRLALGEAITADLQDRQSRLGEEILGALRPLAVREAAGEPTQEAFLNVSFLVERGRGDDFQEAARKLAEGFGRGVQFRLSGPLPPYSFV